MSGIRFLSCFSGLEAASLAFGPLGWECVGVAEIEPFPCEIIRQRLPHVTNMGDVLADDFLDRVAALAPDGVVGGPPCQDFSIAGLRRGLDGDRGNLTLRWVQIIHAARARLRFALTENVPGWLSVNDGHAFGSFLAALVGADSALVPPKQCGGRWTDAGMAAGPEGRAAWRILDAQYQGLAQRRERVFVIFCPRDGADPAEILLERTSVQRNSPPRREAGQRVAGTLEASLGRRSGQPNDHDPAGGLVAAFGGNRTGGELDVATAVNAHGGPHGRLDFESETFIAHALRGEGFDASEDGTGRGTPIIPVAFRTSGNCGAWQTGDRTDALTTGRDPSSHLVCFSSKDHGADAQDDLSPTLRAGGFTTSHANAGVMPAIAFQTRGSNLDVGEISGTLGTNGDRASGGAPMVARRDSFAFDLRGREGGAMPEGPHDTANIRAASGGSSRSYLAVKHLTNHITGAHSGAVDASPDQRNPAEILRALRDEIGAEAFTEWGLGISDSFQPAEVLRPGVHGCGVRCTSGQERSVLGDDASPRAEIGPAGSLHEMRNAGRERRPPQGWQPSKQRSAEFDAALSLLSHQGASRASFLRDLWTAAEGARLLQQALHQMEEIWRPPSVQSAGAENVQGLHSTGSCERSLRDALHEGEASGQSASDCGGIGRGERRLRGWAVRRLTPR